MNASILRLLLVFALSLAGGLISKSRAVDAAPPAAATSVVTPSKEATPPQWTQTRDAALAFILDKAKTYTGKAEDAVNWAVDEATKQVPQLCAEYLRWRFWYHLLHCLVPLFLIALFTTFALWGRREWTLSEVFEDGYATRKLLCGAFACLFGVVSFFSLFIDDPAGTRGAEKAHLYSLVEVVAAPRVYLVEQVVQLARK